MTNDSTNISMIYGDSKSLIISCSQAGVAVPLVNGDTVYFTVKVKTSDTNKVLQKVVTTFTDGKALIEILPADKVVFQVDKLPVNYVYDVQINFANGSVKTVIEPSAFTVNPGVTDE